MHSLNFKIKSPASASVLVPNRLIFQHIENPQPTLAENKVGPENKENSKDTEPQAQNSQKKYQAEVIKLRTLLTQYEQSTDPVIKTGLQKAKEDLAQIAATEKSADPNLDRKLDQIKESTLEKIEAQIVFFNSRDAEKSKKYIEEEGDFSSQKLLRLRDPLAKLADQESFPENSPYFKVYTVLETRIQRVKQIQDSALATINMFQNPEHANQRALILANFKDQLETLGFTLDPNQTEEEQLKTMASAISETEFPEGPFHPHYLHAIEDLAGPDLIDLTAENLQTAQAMAGGSIEDPQVTQSVGKTSWLNGDTPLRLEGGGIQVANVSKDKPTKVQILGAEVYPVTDQNGNKVDYIRVQLDPPNGSIALIPKQNFNFSVLERTAIKPTDSIPQKSQKEAEVPKDPALELAKDYVRLDYELEKWDKEKYEQAKAQFDKKYPKFPKGLDYNRAVKNQMETPEYRKEYKAKSAAIKVKNKEWNDAFPDEDEEHIFKQATKELQQELGIKNEKEDDDVK